MCKELERSQEIPEIPRKRQGLNVIPDIILRKWGLHEIPKFQG